MFGLWICQTYIIFPNVHDVHLSSYTFGLLICQTYHMYIRDQVRLSEDF